MWPILFALVASPELLTDSKIGNLVRLSPTLYCGASPAADGAFAELAARGVRTVVSVDGAEPDAARAKRHGLRYVHLPIGYDGVPSSRILELAKLFREAKGPIFIHCHHGRHRAPAAVAAAAVAAGLLKTKEAEAAMKLAGTGAEYLGLWKSMREAVPVSAERLAGLNVDYREQVAPPPLAAAMLKLDERLESLRRKPTAEDALLLKEGLAELARLPETATRPQEYRRLLEANQLAAEELETDLRSGKPTAAALKLTTKACDACHRKHRDVGQTALGGSWRGRFTIGRAAESRENSSLPGN
jgi:protein tyrosine phosphatase (PTP) superfamily phosphohydrolase (DUF442 family)